MSLKTFKANINHLYEMLEFISQNAVLAGFNAVDISHIEISAEEALVNIISYAYPQGDGDIKITCIPKEGINLYFQILDNGVPFNPLTKPRKLDLHTPVEEKIPGGFGIYFITKMMDEVNYVRENDSNILTLVKHVNKKDV